MKKQINQQEKLCNIVVEIIQKYVNDEIVGDRVFEEHEKMQ